MRTLWRDDVASYDGEFVHFESVRVNPKPVRPSGILVMLDGNSDAALRRVAAWGDPWYGFNLDDVTAVADRLAALRRMCDEHGRDAAELTVAVALRDLRADDLGPLAERGVDELSWSTAHPPIRAPRASGSPGSRIGGSGTRRSVRVPVCGPFAPPAAHGRTTVRR
jgi:alkanesulfonate monooxygenase SsuD/methylene tetrahydromethanopterin reductase-like flavin-dependent oxidoreductase (luciferase family)